MAMGGKKPTLSPFSLLLHVYIDSGKTMSDDLTCRATEFFNRPQFFFLHCCMATGMPFDVHATTAANSSMNLSDGGGYEQCATFSCEAFPLFFLLFLSFFSHRCTVHRWQKKKKKFSPARHGPRPSHAMPIGRARLTPRPSIPTLHNMLFRASFSRAVCAVPYRRARHD